MGKSEARFKEERDFRWGLKEFSSPGGPGESAVLGNRGPQLSPLTFRSENHL